MSVSLTRTTAKQRISDFQKLVNQNQHLIRQAGDQAWANVKNRSEVAAVRDFLAAPGCGTDYLNRVLATVLRPGLDGRVVKFASIFLHQCPMVRGVRRKRVGRRVEREDLPKNCELGDLQTLFLYLDRAKNVCQMRSVIFQAKLKPANGSHVITHPEQRALYEECETFAYHTPPTLKGQRRGLPQGNARARALQYLFVADDPVLVRTQPAASGQGAFMTYGEHLLRFMNDSTGLASHEDSGRMDAWTRIIHDMTETVGAKHIGGKASRKKKTAAKTLRGQGIDPNFRAVLDQFNSFENHDVFHLEFGEDDAVPSAGSGAESDDKGFGVKIVIVWDEKLEPEDGSGSVFDKPSPHGPTPSPPTQLSPLLALAHAYSESHIEDPQLRVWTKDHLAKSMALLILNARLDFDTVQKMAVPPLHNALAAALAMASPVHLEEGDWRRLVALLPLIDQIYPMVLVLRALIATLEEGRRPWPVAEDLLELKAIKTRFAGSQEVMELANQLERIYLEESVLSQMAHGYHMQEEDEERLQVNMLG